MIETSVAALIKAVKLATSTLEPSSPVACSNPIEPVYFRNWYQTYRNLQECTFSSALPHLHRRVVNHLHSDKHLGLPHVNPAVPRSTLQETTHKTYRFQ